MKLTVFQSDKGDCLLLTGEDGTRVLIDGGMRASYRRHVAPALGAIRDAGGRLDLICVSHIDQDHIAGVLQLMEDEVEWRVHDYQLEAGNASHPVPRRPRPPDVARLWHNPFREQVGLNERDIEDTLAQTAVLLEAGDVEDIASAQRDLGTSIGEAIELARRVSGAQLGIPVNEEFGGRLILVRDDPQTIAVGSLRLTVIGPFEQDLDTLRDEWNSWLTRNRQALERIRERMRRDIERWQASEVARVRSAVALRAGELGDRTQVTVPNLASVMLLAEESGQTVLLTGDGHADDILRGLESAGRLDDGAAIHVDVLKVQHHGSEHNIHPEFCRRVTADHYVLCGNGRHENPDLRAIEAIIEARAETDERPYRLWFNSSPAVVSGDDARHMRAVERLVARKARASAGRITFTFLDEDAFEFALGR